MISVDEKYKFENFSNNRYSKESILSGQMIPHQGIIVKTSIMKKYHFNEENYIFSDYEFIVNYLVDGGKIKYIDEPICYYSTNGVSSNISIGTYNWCNMLLERIKIIDKFHLNRYLTQQVNGFLKFSLNQRNHTKRKKIREFFGIEKIYIKVKKKKHSCNLKICRWCGRV